MMKLLLVFGLAAGVSHGEMYLIDAVDVSLVGKNGDESSLQQWSSGRGMALRSPENVKVYYLNSRFDENGAWSNTPENKLIIDCPENQPFKVFFDRLNAGKEGISADTFSFEFVPKQHKAIEKKEYERYLKWYFSDKARQNRWGGGDIGHAYFKAIGGSPNTNRNRNRRAEQVADTMQFFSGGHAIAENLALDRELILGKEKDEWVDLSSIRGVTVDPIDWKPLLKGKQKPQIDLLASIIPEDQHAVFAPSLGSLLEVIDLAETDGVAMQTFSTRNPFRNLAKKYKKQLGLDLPNAVAKWANLGNVALTGYDPFYPTGTDLAIVFEKNHAVVAKAVKAAAISHGLTEKSGEVEGVSYRAYVSEDRSFCSYIAPLGDYLVVSNSLEQIRTLIITQKKNLTTLKDIEEFQYFRHRYPLAATMKGEEDVFIYISDACLRRWCAPQARIGASRRNRAIAAMQHSVSRAIIEKGGKYQQHKPSEKYKDLLGEMNWYGEFPILQSEQYNTLAFMTPLIEMKLTKVSKTEAAAYENWRIQYERGWNTVFDPIAISISSSPSKKSMDVTVLPLRADSDYQEFINLVGKAKLSSKSKRHAKDDLVTLSVALDQESELFKELERGFGQTFNNIKFKPFSWIGESATLKIKKPQKGKKLINHSAGLMGIFEIPMVARIETVDPIKRALLLTALKKEVDTAAPGTVEFQVRKHKEIAYVAVVPKEGLGVGDVGVYYATLPKSLLISFKEDVLKQAIDDESKELGKGGDAEVYDLAKHMFAQATPRDLISMGDFDQDPLDSATGRRFYQSKRAIYILNELRKVNPEWNAQDVYNRLFGSYVVCPSGKDYQWNAKEWTYESPVYGHMGDPKLSDPEFEKLLDSYGDIKAGLEFHDGGVRIRVDLEKPKR